MKLVVYVLNEWAPNYFDFFTIVGFLVSDTLLGNILYSTEILLSLVTAMTAVIAVIAILSCILVVNRWSIAFDPISHSFLVTLQSVSLFIWVRQVSRSETIVGSFTAWSTVSALMVP